MARILKSSTDGFKKRGRKKAGIYTLFSAVSSYMLHPESNHEPFKAVAVFGDRRSPLPEDLSASDLKSLRKILPLVSDNLLKARIADVLWFLVNPREKEFALAAIDAYITFPLDDDKLLGDGKNAWLRAIVLCRTLRTAATARLNKIQEILVAKVKSFSYDQKWHLLDAIELVLECNCSKEDLKEVSKSLESVVNKARTSADWQCIQRFADVQGEIYKRLKDEKAVCQVYKEHAESYASMAETPGNANMLIASWLESAIKIYRQIPHKYRSDFDVDNRIAQLHAKMNAANEKAIGEMGVIQTPPIDLSEIVEHARNHVIGRPFPEAIFRLAYVSHLRERKTTKKSAEKILGQSIVHRLFGTTHLSSDGRVVSRTPGIDLSNAESDSTKGALWHQMLSDYHIGIGLSVSGSILPALQVVNMEHHITERRLLQLCNSSSVVPTGRELLWAKGLYYGFDGDFAAAIHILSPQVENLVRLILKGKNIKTTTLNSGGIETENGLSTLLAIDNAAEALGEDFHFELTALLADSSGSNLRNQISHGLLPSQACYSEAAVYFWWYCLRLVVGGIRLSDNSNAKEET